MSSLSARTSDAPAESTKSVFYEKLVEHVFISELLQEVWCTYSQTVEVLRSEVDSAGYDVVLECNNVLRHVQLKATKKGANAGSQKINIALADKPGGCVIWIVRGESMPTRRMTFDYLYFGGQAGQRLPTLDNYKAATHTKRNAVGKRTERPAIRVVPRSAFRRVESIGALARQLFGLD